MSVPYDMMEAMPINSLGEPEVEEDEQHSKLEKYLDKGNIVDELDDPDKVANDAIDDYAEALESMDPWLKKYKRALNLAKLQAMSGDVEITEKNFPFEGASIVMMPYILEAMLDFSSRAAGELVWANSIVHAKIYGEKTKEKEERAERVSDFMNYQLAEMIPNWRDDQDKGLLILASPGTFYKETYFNYNIQEVCSDLRLADEVVFNHNYKSFDLAPDKFVPCKYTKNEVIGFIRGKQKWQIEEEELPDDEDIEFIRSYIWIDLDDDGLEEPYIAIVWEEKTKVVALYPNYDEDTINLSESGEVIEVKRVDVFTQYRFLPDPEGGPMGMGWGILLGPMFDAINTNVRQLIDSGTLANAAANSGLISQSLASGRGNSAESGPIEVVMGQLTPVPNHGAGSLRDNIIQFPFAGPNPTLFQLMEYLVQSSRSMTNAAVNVEASPGEAASLYLAKLQQGLKVPNSIIMRVYECAKRELQKIAQLNYKHYDDKKYNKVLDLNMPASMKNDFNPEDCDIRMTADPSQGSDIERVMRAQTVYQLAESQTEQIIVKRQATLDLLDAMKTPNIEELAPEPDPNAVDPMKQLAMAQMAAEMELRKEDQALRHQEIVAKRQKMALDAAKEMGKIGLAADKQEAEITKLYSETLKNLVDAGIATGQGAVDFAHNIESQFIDAKGGDIGQVPKTNPGSSGAVGGSPGNEGLSTMP